METVTDPANPAERQLAYSPESAAEALDISRSTIYNMMADGRLPSFKIGRCRRIPAEAIQSLMAELMGVAA